MCINYDLNTIDGGFLKEGDRFLMRSRLMGAASASDRELLSIVCPDANNDDVKEILSKMYKPGFDVDMLNISENMRPIVNAAFELGKRLNQRKGRIITCPADVFREVAHFANNEQEMSIVVALNGAHEVLSTYVVTIGQVDKIHLHPREVFAPAIQNRATAVVLAHNHPSGILEPTGGDRETTRRLNEAGGILGIKLLDHIVFSYNGYYSFLEHGLL